MIELIIILIVGLVLGWKYREWTAIAEVNKAKKLAEMAKAVAEAWIPVKFEQQDGRLYCYHGETGEFLAQGDDQKELSQNLVSRFPGKRFTMSRTDTQKFTIRYEDARDESV